MTNPAGVRARLLHVAATPFAWPLLLFAVSAIWGRAIAFDAAGASAKLALVGSALLIYVGLAAVPSRVTGLRRSWPLLRAIVAAAPSLLAAWFLVTHDWAAPVAKAGWLDPVRGLLAAALPRLPWLAPHPNVVGGVLAMWLPLQCAALASRRAGARHVRMSPAAVAVVAFTAFALLMTGLRGAWLALALAVAVVAVIVLAGRSRSTRGGPSSARTVIGVAVVALVCLGVASVVGAWWYGLRPDRWFVWDTSLELVRDYALTGLGLGGFAMAYSSYVLVTHVPHTTHAHNLFLDLWLEQGPVGAIAFAALLAMAITGATRRLAAHASDSSSAWPRWSLACLVSLLFIVIHGLVDDVFYGYEGGGLAALLVPEALVSRRGEHVARTWSWRDRRRLALAAAVVFLLVIATPQARSLWQSSAGAVRQGRAELSTYSWPRWPVQDAVRRAIAPRLAAAVSRYESALRIDAGNASAARRLGQIELSLGRYDEARRHLEAAYESAPGVYATRLLLAEALAVTGDVESAAALWRSLDVPADRLAGRQWWYDHADPGQRAEWFREAVAMAQ